MMKKAFILVVTVMAALFIFNELWMKKEEAIWLDPPGRYVEVDGHKMHIYSEGEGEHTIVFMSAWGDTSPYANFLPLCKNLSAYAKVVIIERFGYGLSDTVDGERTFDKILEEDREGLAKAGIKGPFVLCPHSISGLEATLWAQRYPSEVEGIVAMDTSIASMRDVYEKQGFNIQIPIFIFLQKTGILRVINGIPKNETDKMVTAISCRNEVNKNVISENKHIVEACDEIDKNPLPTVPTIQYVSKQAGDAYPKWITGHQAIADASVDGKCIMLDCGHYVYKFEEKRIAGDIKEFIESINSV
ncbi:MAG: alpha/beta hydrolase [Butyrivibrio sp.]|nr:alpha/beta hydrolase [Butyrivibrio sp.]